MCTVYLFILNIKFIHDYDCIRLSIELEIVNKIIQWNTKVYNLRNYINKSYLKECHKIDLYIIGSQYIRYSIEIEKLKEKKNNENSNSSGFRSL